MFEDLADLKAGKVDKVRGQHYDLVLDGQEVGGGSVRVHDAGLQEYILKEVLQVSIKFTLSELHRSVVRVAAAEKYHPEAASCWSAEVNESPAGLVDYELILAAE